jgi:hypothetical protein
LVYKKAILVNKRKDIIKDSLNTKKNILEYKSIQIEEIKKGKI